MGNSDQRTSQAMNETPPVKRRSSKKRLIASGLVTAAAVYLTVAYVVAPLIWERYADRHPSFDDNPRITKTSDGHPGDPLNVGLFGSQADIESTMKAARWYPAAALGLRSDLKIASDTVLSRPDDEAPVSNLFLFDRKEDLAFEQPVGDNPRQRHHVRFWKTNRLDDDDLPLWIGSASYDERVGLSDTTGQITHHISGDVDAERDHILKTLQQTGDVAVEYLDNFQAQRSGRNGGGDLWKTDGRLGVGTIHGR